MTTPADLLEQMATRLKPLLAEIVFLGGCATQLLITDAAAAPVRITDDVDVIVEITSLPQYAKFSKRLRHLGFREDSSEGAPICRFIAYGLKLDVMPTDEKILGFSNRWYKSALKGAQTIEFHGLKLRVVTAPHFLATKLEAFKGRGGGDVYASKDLEDIIAVIDAAPRCCRRSMLRAAHCAAISVANLQRWSIIKTSSMRFRATFRAIEQARREFHEFWLRCDLCHGWPSKQNPAVKG